MKYFFSAGEASGDVHAAQVIRELRRLDGSAEIAFLGGDEMAAAAGHDPLIHYRRMAYMGFIDVARHLPEVLGNLAEAKRAIAAMRPDALVLVDYPGFNLKLAEYAHGLGIPVHYYIAPKLWAWKEYRIKKLRRYVDRLYSILPFEPQWFGERGVKAEYVGNPSVEEVEQALAAMPPAEEFMKIHGLDTRPVLALVPGSRMGEIKANLPVMDAVARRHPEMQAVVAGAPSIDVEVYRRFTDYPVIHATTLRLMSYSRAALVTSGTASLESALAGAPQVVCYRAVGWKWAHDLFMHILKIPYCSLPNLVTGRIDREARDEVNRQAVRTGVRGWIIPEMLVHNCTPDTVDTQLTPLLTDTPARRAQLEGYDEVRRRLFTSTSAAATVARNIYGHRR
ncbi:lipid-A-disaccharide synthase [Muribaculaceae bacterium Isolate-110 (HZI)]|nr:lipid-A-disaccharide synthase [Muribaculaceae bacterium Isolate-110 (HZI)]